MALKGWVECSDGRLYHTVVAEKANEAWKHRQAQRDRANKRWGNAEPGKSGNAAANATGHPTAHATASPAAMQGTGTGTVKDKSPSPPLEQRPRALPDDVRRVMEEGGFISPPPDLDQLKGWYAAGADLEQDILPTVRRVAGQLSKAPFRLKVFDAAVREKLAKDANEIEHLRKVARRNAPAEAQAEAR